MIACRLGVVPPNRPVRLAPVNRSERRIVAMSLRGGAREVHTTELDAALADIGTGASFIHFKSEWCPDCIRSNAVVREAVTGAGKHLLVVDVGAREEWKTPVNPLRSDPRFLLSGIPTLVFWQGGKSAAKLGAELEGAPTTTAAQKVVEAFVASHGSS